MRFIRLFMRARRASATASVVSVVKPHRKFCFSSNIVRVRAILSWNIAPPPNTPNYTPVWGNIHNTHIQVAPRLGYQQIFWWMTY
jgi:hypothetical protein